MAALLLLIAVCIFAVPIGTDAYETPRDTLLAVGVLPVLGVGGVLFAVPLPFLILLACMAAFWFVRSVDSWNTENSVKHAFKFCSAMVLSATAVAGMEAGQILACLAWLGAINAVVAGLQYCCMPVPFKNMTCIKTVKGWKNGKRTYRFHGMPIGLVGNSNYLGVFLVPCLFAALHVGNWFCAALIVGGLLLSGCKVAIFACAFAFIAMYNVLLAVLLFAGLICVFRNHKTFIVRRKYWKAAFNRLRSEWLFGVGFDNWKNSNPFDRYEVGTKSDPKVCDENRFPPRKCHNDYIQAVLDNGVFGLLLYAAVLGYGLYCSDGFIRAGLVGLAVAGMGFHGFHVTPVNIALWLMVFIGVKTGGVVGYGGVWLPVLLMPFALLTMPFVRRLVAEHYFYRALNGDRDALFKAAEADPWYSPVRFNLFRVKFPREKTTAFMDCIDMINRYDGETELSVLFRNAGEMFDAMKHGENGFLELADKYEGC